MTRRWVLAGAAAGLALALTAALSVSAHEGGGESGLSVEPDNLAAGGSVVLAGTGLEPNSERVLVLAGPDMVVQLGSVTTDAEGMFQKEIKIPSHMPAGSYELRAIGDETLTVALALTAADGVAAAASGDSEANTVVPRQRLPLELGLIGVGVLVAAIFGVGLIGFAERVAHEPVVAEN